MFTESRYSVPPLRLLLLLPCLLLLACREPAEALSPPAGFFTAAAKPSKAKAVSQCPELTPFTGALDFPSRYQGSDEARDDENPKAAAEYRRRVKPINAMEREINQRVEGYLETGDALALDCALSRLARWADAGALLGEVKSHTGKSMRKWALGSLAAAYLRAKFSASQPLLREYADQGERIESWFSTLAHQVVEDWDGLPREKINNHVYWAAWSVMAAAVATDERALFYWAIEQYRVGVDQINEQGLLPNELDRDTRALFYHNYALPPLTMIAAFAEVNGVSLVDFRDGSLDRLVAAVLRGVAQPEYFAELTGSEQNLDDFKDSKFTWLEPYCWLKTCSESTRQLLDDKRPLHNYRVGGDVTALFSFAPPAGAARQQSTDS